MSINIVLNKIRYRIDQKIGKHRCDTSKNEKTFQYHTNGNETQVMFVISNYIKFTTMKNLVLCFKRLTSKIHTYKLNRNL